MQQAKSAHAPGPWAAPSRPSYGAPSTSRIRPTLTHEFQAELKVFEPFGWRLGRNALTPMGKRAAEQNLLNEQDRAERTLAYIVALEETTDAEWRHEMASGDDFREGRRHFQRLWDMQIDLDLSGDMWRSIAPQGFAVPQPRLPGISCSQCGRGFGHGKWGFSRCADHAHLSAAS